MRMSEESSRDVDVDSIHYTTLKFQELVDFLLRVASIRRRLQDEFNSYGKASVTQRRGILINEFVSQWRHQYETHTLFYILLRMALADRDRARSYHIKELSLSSMICSIYGINKDTDEYKRLFNGDLYAELNAKYSKSHKLAAMMAEIISSRQVDVAGGVYDIVQIDTFLNQLDYNYKNELARSENKPKTSAQQKSILKEMFANMNHDELRYIILIILKCRIIGHSENLLLKAWHPDAPSYFAVVSNLETVYQRLKDPSQRLNKEELSVHVMHPFAPQLAAQPKKSYARIVDDFGGNFLIEEKLDGERLQMHMEKVNDQYQFKFFSRKATDYTLVYGDSFENGSLAPHFKEVIGDRRLKAISKLVLDGEVLSYDMKRNIVLPLGTLKTTNVETIFDSQSAFRPLYVIFDILLINDKLLCDQPLFKRKGILKQLINPKPHHIEVIHSADALTEEDIQIALQDAIESNSEGIIVKDKRKKYKIDDRNDCWIKVKPEYMQEFGANMDLCIIGKLPSKKTSYICGLRVGTANVFQSFCSIANGISFSDAEKIESLTIGKWHNFEKEPPPVTIQFASRKPVEWIHPQDSLVLEVKARNIEYGLYGKLYKVGSTLLSGYMKSVRTDKDWRTSMSLEEFLSWKQLTDSNGSKQHNIEDKLKKRARVTRPQLNFRQPLAVSDLFRDIVFFVLSDYALSSGNFERIEIQQIKETIKKHGGVITNSEKIALKQNQVLIPISERRTIEVNMLHNAGYDIISPEWVYDCIEIGEIALFEPRHLFLTSKELTASAYHRVDNWGDSHVINTKEQLFRKISDKLNITLAKKSKIEHEFSQELQETLPNNIFGVFFSTFLYIVRLEDIFPPYNELQHALDFGTNQHTLLARNLFVKPWEISLLDSLIRENGGVVTYDFDSAHFVIVPNYINTDYLVNENIGDGVTDTFIKEYYKALEEKLAKIRRKNSESPVKLEHDYSNTSKYRRIVNEKFIFDSISEDALVPAEEYQPYTI